jgi:SNF2 family DNA or RNA helicase
MIEPTRLKSDTSVEHRDHGQGRVVADLGATTIVRFGTMLHNVLRDELNVTRSLDAAVASGDLDDSQEVLLRAQAMCIRSVNDQWGVFSRSRVKLLPHQLWVCHRVNQSWPFRWLIADDVGLGKTIECGLVLMPLIASGRVRRLLILAPAKLVPQWQKRLREMFDIRLQAYAREVDRGPLDFWATANMVVASIHTLRGDSKQTDSALLEADPWDLVVVDEAHHLNADERLGETLAYGLIRELEARRKIQSLLLFTGTPHRGKDFGFFSLMHLVRPDLFKPDAPPGEQMGLLRDAMIRNNKATATDLLGNRLFTPVTVESREYHFSDDERQFYDTLSSFILDGRAYALGLDGRGQTARMLVLITLQKLAASSIAAVRSALTKRRERLATLAKRVRDFSQQTAQDEDLDEAAELEEATPAEILVELMDGEVGRLDDLVELASRVQRETKIRRLVELIEGELPAEEPVLLFTEYKATQALVVDELHARFGYGSCAFINGDERLDTIHDAAGQPVSQRWSRDAAADAFNTGKARFLVSTEAAGEGIDLQHRCATLIHVDMPWNPMRLHQRVGRLSRYGQERPVAVYILRNPDTVEARIWDLLNAKLGKIQGALSSVMDEGEDISQLVVGMSGAGFFSNLFAEAEFRPRESLIGWFDRETATIEGEDVVARVKAMLGNVARFDFQQVGQNLPHADLPDLERFFIAMLDLSGRRVFKREDGLEVKTPDEWLAADYALRERYSGLVFDRAQGGGRNGATLVLGVGHRLFDTTLAAAERLTGVMAPCRRLDLPLVLMAIEDEVTGSSSSVGRIIVAGRCEADSSITLLRDWEALLLLNRLAPAAEPAGTGAGTHELVRRAVAAVKDHLSDLSGSMSRPRVLPQLLLLPLLGAPRS